METIGRWTVALVCLALFGILMGFAFEVAGFEVERWTATYWYGLIVGGVNAVVLVELNKP